MAHMRGWLLRVMPLASAGNTYSRNSDRLPPQRAARWSFVNSTSDFRKSEWRSVLVAVFITTSGLALMALLCASKKRALSFGIYISSQDDGLVLLAQSLKNAPLGLSVDPSPKIA